MSESKGSGDSSVLRFPRLPSLERERILEVATSVLPLLQVALETGNSKLIREVFAFLGEVSRDGDALEQLKTITIRDGDVVEIHERTGGAS